MGFSSDVIDGLARPNKELACKYFYDERGSQLFEQICELDEYYVTRVELGILRENSEEIARVIGPDAIIVEFGSGDGAKTEILLDSLDHPSAYVPVDISGQQLHEVAARVSTLHPSLRVVPLNLDFTQPFQLPSSVGLSPHIVVFFPGSTIGNFVPEHAVEVMKQMRRICGPNGSALIGFDLHKEVNILQAAYNDSQGVTAEFNLNLLHRINRELSGTFDISEFRHVAEYNLNLRRIELSLESTRRQSVSVAGRDFQFEDGERIHTEYSYKYSVEDFSRMALDVGLHRGEHWTDRSDYFAVGKFDAV